MDLISYSAVNGVSASETEKRMNYYMVELLVGCGVDSLVV